MDPNTFSSEINDVHETRRQGDSFSNEFQGAPDHVIESSRPQRVTDIGRGGRRALTIVVVLALVLGGGGWAFWYWSEPIGEWIAGLGRDTQSEDRGDEQPELAPADSTAVPPDLPAQDPDAGPDKVFGIRGAPEGSAPAPTPAPSAPTPAPSPEPTTTPPTPTPPTPTPVTGTAKVEVLAKSVSGKVSAGRIDKQHGQVQTALEACWKSEVAAGRATAITLQLGFRIKWNGRRGGVSASGGGDVLRKCVSDAVPRTGWPQPRDGGEAKVSWSWSLTS